MKLSATQVILVIVGILAYFAVLYFADNSVTRKTRPWFRFGAVGSATSVTGISSHPSSVQMNLFSPSRNVPARPLWR